MTNKITNLRRPRSGEKCERQHGYREKIESGVLETSDEIALSENTTKTNTGNKNVALALALLRLPLTPPRIDEL